MDFFIDIMFSRAKRKKKRRKKNIIEAKLPNEPSHTSPHLKEDALPF